MTWAFGFIARKVSACRVPTGFNNYSYNPYITNLIKIVAQRLPVARDSGILGGNESAQGTVQDFALHQSPDGHTKLAGYRHAS